MHVTPYHPMGNGLTERFNRTLLHMLGTLTTEQRHNWKKYVGPMVHAYNSLRQETTGQTPYFLMFGRQPRLPVDIAFELDQEITKQPMTTYVAEMKDRLQKAYNLASKATKEAQGKQKGYYDLKVRGNNTEVGDRVMVKTVAFEGKHKLANRWEEEPYVVLDRPNPDIPVYVVRKENGEGHKRTSHRNLLLPIGTLNLSDSFQTVTSKKPTPAPRRKKNSDQRTTAAVAPESKSEETDDSSDDELLCRKVVNKPRPLKPSQEHKNDAGGEHNERGADDEDNDEDDYGGDDDDDDDDHDDDPSVEQIEQPEDEIIEEADAAHSIREPNDNGNVRLRRSARQRKQPKWMNEGEFVVNMVCRAMMNAVLDKS